MYTVYVLRSEKDDKLYVGSTGDLERRLAEHDNGKVISTRHRRPLKLVYTEEYADKQRAVTREMYLKGGGKARALLKQLINDKGV